MTLIFKLMEARNILLYTILIDDCKSGVPKDWWSLFFDLYIDTQTTEAIRQQSEKLTLLSHSMETWNASEYAIYLRIINIETLNLLAHYWTQYCNPTSAFYKSYRAAVTKIYKEEYKDSECPGFSKAAGPQSLSINLLHHYGDWVKAFEQYWKNGTFADDTAGRTRCNPLFAYSQAGGDKFTVRKDSLPLSGFHLITSLTKIHRSSPYFLAETGDSNGQLERAVKTAKLQFRIWCDAFRRAVSNSRIQIRFICCDAISLIIALNKDQQMLGEVANRYSRPGSAKPLYLDKYDGPTTFDVVDTSYLVDSIGFHNLIPYVLPLFASDTSVLYTNTLIDGKDEKHILSSMLCTSNIGIMCTFYGIAPTSYISGLTTRAHQQDNPDYSKAKDSVKTIVISRLTWRTIRSLDSAAVTIPICSAEELAKFLIRVFVRMLPTRILVEKIPIYRPPNYTVASFALLLRFLQHRVQVDWEEVMPYFFRELDIQPGALLLWQELLMYLHLFGVQESHQIDVINSAHPSPIRETGVLSRTTLPETVGLIITVPRQNLITLYQKAINGTGTDPLCIRFWIHLSWENRPSRLVFMCVQSVFGKLNVNNEEATIDEDVKGWHGSSHLHLCAYFPTQLLYGRDLDRTNISVRLSKETDTQRMLYQELGPELEVFQTSFKYDNISILSSLPGLKSPAPQFSYDPPQGTTELDFTSQAFKTRITLTSKGENHQALVEGADINIKQTSPCTISVTYATFNHICKFPFPVVGATARLRVSRTNGWMEVIVPLISKSNHVTTPFPLQRSISTVSTWNLPYINFHQLPKLDMTDPEAKMWKQFHLLSMFTDHEMFLRQKRDDMMTSIKNSIHAMLAPSKRIIQLKCGTESITFLMSGWYLDLNSHCVIADVYILFNVSIESVERITITESAMKWWNSNFPAMAERCRDYAHLESCEYTSSVNTICSCGKGKVGSFPTLLLPEWDSLKPDATRIVISPIFCAPYLENTRGLFDSFLTDLNKGGLDQKERYLLAMQPITDKVEELIWRSEVCCLL